MYCTKCGVQISDDASFCTACGAQTEAHAAETRCGESAREKSDDDGGVGWFLIGFFTNWMGLIIGLVLLLNKQPNRAKSVFMGFATMAVCAIVLLTCLIGSCMAAQKRLGNFQELDYSECSIKVTKYNEIGAAFYKNKNLLMGKDKITGKYEEIVFENTGGKAVNQKHNVSAITSFNRLAFICLSSRGTGFTADPMKCESRRGGLLSTSQMVYILDHETGRLFSPYHILGSYFNMEFPVTSEYWDSDVIYANLFNSIFKFSIKEDGNLEIKQIYEATVEYIDRYGRLFVREGNSRYYLTENNGAYEKHELAHSTSIRLAMNGLVYHGTNNLNGFEYYNEDGILQAGTLVDLNYYPPTYLATEHQGSFYYAYNGKLIKYTPDATDISKFTIGTVREYGTVVLVLNNKVCYAKGETIYDHNIINDTENVLADLSKYGRLNYIHSGDYIGEIEFNAETNRGVNKYGIITANGKIYEDPKRPPSLRIAYLFHV